MAGWQEVLFGSAEHAPAAPVNSTWLVRLVPVLVELDQPEQAALALRRAVSEEQSISLATLLGVLKLASGVDAQAVMVRARPQASGSEMITVSNLPPASSPIILYFPGRFRLLGKN